MDTPEPPAAEPSAPEAQPVPAPSPPISGRFTRSDGLGGWLDAKATHSPLYGNGTAQIAGDELILQGWQFTWIAAPVQAEFRAPLSQVTHAACHGNRVFFDVRAPRRWRRHIEFVAQTEQQAASLIAQLQAVLPVPGRSTWIAQREFMERLETAAPRAVITPLLILLNVLAYVIVAVAASNAYSIDIATLVKWGGNLGAFELQGQWWRMLTAFFLHANLLHLLVNMWMLWGASRLVERLYGRWTFLALYLLCGICASATSSLWEVTHVGVGASGAIFGVIGALIAFLVRRDLQVPRSIAKPYLLSTAIFAAYNLIGGFMDVRIDNAAHVGGLIAGLALGSILARPVDPQAAFPAKRVAAAVAVAICMVLATFWSLGSLGGGLSAFSRYWGSHRWYQAGEAQSLVQVTAILNKFQAHESSRAETAEALRVGPAHFWNTATARLAADKPDADASLHDYAVLFAAYASRRADWANALADGVGEGTRDSAARLVKVGDEMQLAFARLQRRDLRDSAVDRQRSLSRRPLITHIRRMFRHPECVGRSAQTLRTAPSGNDAGDGPLALAKIACDTQLSFARADVATLEQNFAKYSSSLGDLLDGSSSLAAFVTGLDEILATTAVDEALATLADWHIAHPTSLAPQLGEAMLYENVAWKVRGEDTADTVPRDAWPMFNYQLEMENAALQEIQPRRAMSPVWYQLAIRNSVDRSADRDARRVTFEEGRKLFPAYLPIYASMLRGLQPKWGGSYREMDSMISTSAGRVPEKSGAYLYARLYWYVALIEDSDFALFDKTPADWKAIHKGFDELIERYPKSTWLVNGFARFACVADDKETYAAMRKKMAGKVWPDAWPGNTTATSCDKRFRSL
jgi:membrane associated rhomboid family serine protease